jgi:hypothetical protein
VLQNYLTRLYTTFGSGTSYGGINSLYNKILDEGKYDISKREVKDFLTNTDSYTLHAPASKTHDTQRVISGSLNELHQSDLMDMSSLAQYNNGFRYIIIIIDCFSKKAWGRCLKNKSGDSIVDALKEIYQQTDYPDLF